jgi:hypothetical protein
MPGYYHKNIEYINLRLSGEDRDSAGKRVKASHYLASELTSHEYLYEEMKEQQELIMLSDKLQIILQKCMIVRDSILELKGFQIDN